jgi:hypothetical protein
MLDLAIRIVTIVTVMIWLTAPKAALAAADCGALEDLKVENTNLLSSTVVPAADDLPEYCRVLGYVRPAINFEIRLPTKDWNGKFYMAGCRAWCGKVEVDRPGFTTASIATTRSRPWTAVTAGPAAGTPPGPMFGTRSPASTSRSARSRRPRGCQRR